MKIIRLPKTRKKWYQPIVRYEYGESEAENYIKRLTYTKEQLAISVNNIIKIHEYEVRSADTLFGGIRRLFSEKIDPDNIRIDGMKLQQLFEYSGTKPPFEISKQDSYSADIDSIRKILSKM